MKKMKFPSCFPENCPPEDAISKELLVYRMTKNNPATEEDFIPYIELYPKKFESLKNNALAYGVSVFEDFSEMDKYRKAIPGLRKNLKHTACGYTIKESGVIKSTPSENKSTHLTWWLFDNVYPHTFFEMHARG